MGSKGNHSKGSLISKRLINIFMLFCSQFLSVKLVSWIETCWSGRIRMVFLDFSDMASFKSQCEEAKNLGFDGKTLIHPSQIEIANDIFGTSIEDIERARKIILAWEEATAEGKAVAVVDDQLIESMHVEEAKQLVELHS